MIRVVVPDSHGSKIDKPAKRAFLADLRRLDPEEGVFLGDHVDCDGLWSKHAPLTAEDREYSYHEDIAAANEFLDECQEAAPRCRWRYLSGNHEWHVHRWAAANLMHKADVNLVTDALAPHMLLKLKERGIRFYHYLERYDGLSIPNTIQLGHCFFTHGVKASKHATAAHVEAFGGNVCHGHTHRAQAFITKTITSEAIGGWCPGTLAQLRPAYLHTSPSSWTHGYGAQFFSKRSGRFLHINVPIVGGVSLLGPLLDRMKAPA
jgi:hypothetical protein